MGRNKNKVVYIFRGEGTLTPPNLTMNTRLENWFLDWALDPGHRYILLLPNTVKYEKSFIPESVIFKADYVFTDEGSTVNKYKGLKWMAPISHNHPEKPQYDMFFKFLSQRYESFIYMSHEKDVKIRTTMNDYKNWEHYDIQEWKDTALFMKRLIWERRDVG